MCQHESTTEARHSPGKTTLLVLACARAGNAVLGFRLAGLVEADFGPASEYGVDAKCGVEFSAEDEDDAIAGQEGALGFWRG